MRGNTKIILALIIVIVGIVLLINYLKNNTAVDEQTAKCIASKSQLYVKEGCHYCAQQEQILGDYLSLFNIVECTKNLQECESVLGVSFSIPTWIINSKQYVGVRSLNELKRLTRC